MHLRFGVNKGCYANHKRRKIAAFLNISFNFMMVQLSFVWHFSFGQPFCPTFTRLMDRIRRIYIKRGTLQVKYQGLNIWKGYGMHAFFRLRYMFQTFQHVLTMTIFLRRPRLHQSTYAKSSCKVSLTEYVSCCAVWSVRS